MLGDTELSLAHKIKKYKIKNIVKIKLTLIRCYYWFRSDQTNQLHLMRFSTAQIQRWYGNLYLNSSSVVLFILCLTYNQLDYCIKKIKISYLPTRTFIFSGLFKKDLTENDLKKVQKL